VKKLLSLLLCTVLLFCLVACESSSSPQDGEEGLRDGWDPSVDHKVIMDDSGTRILIADLDGRDAPNGIDIAECIVWEWDANDTELKGKGLTLDEAGFRYSAYWERNVVIFCCSSGYVGAIDYMTRELLFWDKPGYGPHSVELLPSGDMIVACSGNSHSENGRVLYYPLTQGKTTPTSSVPLVSAHGVCWDPENEVSWVLGNNKIIACIVKDGKLVELSGMGVTLNEGGGHDLSPVYGHPGLYWVSTGTKLWIFDSNEGTVTNSFAFPVKYTGSQVKGIAWFPDGTMISTAHDQGGTGYYRSSEFLIRYLNGTKDEEGNQIPQSVIIPHRKGSETYKVHTFSGKYQ